MTSPKNCHGYEFLLLYTYTYGHINMVITSFLGVRIEPKLFSVIPILTATWAKSAYSSASVSPPSHRYCV